MAITVHADDVAKTALAQVGKSCGKTNPYSAELDKVHFYNYPKNGIADSCSIFVDDMVYRNTSPKTAHNARSVLYEPDVDNCGAGVVFAAQYFKAHKAWIDGKNAAKAKVGDKVIFAADKYKKKANPYGYYHTGVVVAVDTKNKKITTVEGNTNGGKVAKKTYSFTNSVITKGGFGRPRYTGAKKPVPIPTPEPLPEPTPVNKEYQVKTNSGDTLRIRKEATTKSAELGSIPSGKTIIVSEKVTGESISGCTDWGKTTYNGITGYVSMKYLIEQPKPTPSPAPQPAPKKYTYQCICNIGANIRSGPGTNYTKVGALNYGETVTGEAASGGWVHVTKKNGYVKATLLKKI